MIVVIAAMLLTACSEPQTVRLTYFKYGSYKVAIRDLEFLHSGIHNIDVCVTNVQDNSFPTTKGFQCFLNGYDFVDLSVKWRSAHVIDIYFRCGNVSSFSNGAVISGNRKAPDEFHVFMHDADSCTK